MRRVLADLAAWRWAPYLLAGGLLCADYALLARALPQVRTGFDYRVWSLNRGLYSDVLSLSLDHYIRAGHVIHPLPYIHDRIEYPVLLGFALWLPTWLPGGPASWLAAAGVMMAAATFGSIHLVRRLQPSAVWWIAASPALLLDGAINWDLIGIFFLVAAVVWFCEERYGWSGAAAAVGVCFKLFPVVVVPMAIAALGARWWRSAGTLRGDDGLPLQAGDDGAVALRQWLTPFLVVCGVVILPFLIAAPANTAWFVRFNDLRLQKDSIWGLLGLFVPSSWVSNPHMNTISLLAVVAAMGYGVSIVWRLPPERQARGVALATAMVLIVWMAVNKIWNPQYVLWVAAAGALTSAPASFGVALGAFSVYDWWFEFHLRLPVRPLAYLDVGYSAVAIRIVVLAALAIWVGRELRRLVSSPAEVQLDDPTPARTAL